LKAASNDLLALLSSMGLVVEQLRQLEISGAERRHLKNVENGCDLRLEELEDALRQSRLGDGIPDEIADLRSKIVEETNALTSFYEQLQRSAKP